MKRLMFILSLVGLAVTMIAVGSRPTDTRRGFSKPAVTAGVRSDAEKPRIAEAYGKLPLSFEANKGQTDRRVKFISRGAGYTLFVTPDEAVMALNKPQQNVQIPDRLRHVPQQEKAIQVVLRIKLVGGNTNARATGVEGLAGKSNYFIGDDRTKWRTNVPNYSKVKLQDIYPGIDLAYYGNQRQLEEDFVVAAGADPTAIAMKIGGADKISISDGDLVLAAEGGEVRLRKPIIYQETLEGRRDIPGEYALRDNQQVTFKVATYDRTQPLIIDPVLAYSTYLGGSNQDYGQGIAVDSSGNAYVTGATFSTDFPGTSSSPIQSVYVRGSDAFVTEINASGTALVYSTYLNGSNPDPTTGVDYTSATGIAVDSSGNAYVIASTTSTNFPGTSSSPIQSAYVAGGDTFVTEINAGGTALVYSTYQGGIIGTGNGSIAVDSSGNAYVTGATATANFPGTSSSPIQSTTAGYISAFVTEINAGGTALVYSTCLRGNSGASTGRGIAVDSSGNAYVTGYTSSTDFLGTSSSRIQSTLAGYISAFVTEINAGGTALVYSTYLGGAKESWGYGIAVDSSGNAYVTGGTQSNDFPGTNSSPIQSTFAGTGRQGAAFVTEINAGGTALVYSTYLTGLTGSCCSIGQGIAVDSSGNAYVTGSMGSTDFPGISSSSIQSALGGSDDAFVTEINAGGTAPVYSTYLGGSNQDYGQGIAVDSSGNAYVTGYTASTNFPGTSSSLIQSALAGSFNAFVAKIGNSVPGNTPAGTNVSVSPTGGTPATLAFSNVTQAGNTTLTTSSSGTPPPTGFESGNPPTYLDLTTTALFSGPITVCINYSRITFSDPSEVRLFHFEGGSWVDVTVSQDTTNQIICGTVTSLSPFAVFQRAGGLSTLSMGPQAMDGDLTLSAGARLQAGYDFTMPGSHPAATVSFLRATVAFAWTCVSNTSSRILVVSMADQSYTDAASSPAWYPSGDQQSPLVYQGSTVVPNVCGGGLVNFKKGGTFTTGTFSTDTKDKANVRWHYSGGGAGGWSGTQSVVP